MAVSRPASVFVTLLATLGEVQFTDPDHLQEG
jgi:hypothetical protein